MSGGEYCRCQHKNDPDHRERYWHVLQRECNHSAFNGYHYTPSDYSQIGCSCCLRLWRTKAAYVNTLADDRGEWEKALYASSD